MITFVRTSKIAPGKVVEALAFAHQIAKLVEKITGLKVGVSMPVGGNPFRIAWVAAEPDLASVEANNNKLLSNPEYMKWSKAALRFSYQGRRTTKCGAASNARSRRAVRKRSRPTLVLDEDEIRFVAGAAFPLLAADFLPDARVDRREAGLALGVQRDLGDEEPLGAPIVWA